MIDKPHYTRIGSIYARQIAVKAEKLRLVRENSLENSLILSLKFAPRLCYILLIYEIGSFTLMIACSDWLIDG